MAAYLTLYCARPVSHVNSKDVLTGMDYTRLAAEAADWDFTDREQIDSALANLRVSTSKALWKAFHVGFRPDQRSGVPVLLIAEPARVAECLEGALSSLAGAPGPKAEQVRERLRRTVECVSIRLGWDEIDMGYAIGWLAAGFFARLGDAVILDPYDNWVTFAADSLVVLYRPDQDG
jgi:hypothetical protein